jgi:hypothetical protein
MKKLMLCAVVCVAISGVAFGAEKDKVDRQRIELLQERLARIEAQSVILQQQFKEAKDEYDRLVAKAKEEDEAKNKERKDEKPVKK